MPLRLLVLLALLLPTAAAQSSHLGLVAHHVPDVGAAAAWYTDALQQEPVRTGEAVVFDLGGYGLGLVPTGVVASWEAGMTCAGPAGTTAYWRVPDAAEALDRLRAHGATVAVPLTAAGRYRTALVTDPFGNRLGLVEGPPVTLRLGS